MRKDKSKLEIATAYHEAGHAVVAYFLKLKIKKVSIKEEGNYWGRTILESDPAWFILVESSARIELRIKHKIMYFLAGGITEKKFTKQVKSIADSYDKDGIAFHLGFEKRNTEQTEAYLKKLQIRTEEIVTLRWKYIEMLAKKLLEYSELSGNDIKSFIVKLERKRS